MSNAKAPRILVCGIHQESNSFNPVLSTAKMFGTLEGEEMRAIYGKDTGITGGIIDTLTDAGADIVCGKYTYASSGAPMEDAVPAALTESTLALIRETEGLDGIVFTMHGASLSPSSDDVCGDMIAAVRAQVGEDMPIAAAFDLHANITDKIAKSTDYICGYLAYPHIDRHETGARAARLLLRHLAGKPAKTALVKIPMIAPAHAYTTESGALKELVTYAKGLVSAGGILDYTIFQAQPWLDAGNVATAVVVIADTAEVAKGTAAALARRNFDIRYELQGEPLLTVEEIIEKAVANKTGKPVVLVDSADSRGAGSTADSAAVIGALLPHKDRLRAAAAVTDAPAVAKAFEVGVGNRADFTLGATVAPSLSAPVLVKDALVRSLHVGEFYAVGPIGRGSRNLCGRVAVLQVGGVLIQVAEYGGNEKDINFFRSFGIDPEFCNLVSVKACTSLRAGYTPISAEILNTATPGAAGTILTDLPYKKRPVPLFPFEEIEEKDISEAVCYR